MAWASMSYANLPTLSFIIFFTTPTLHVQQHLVKDAKNNLPPLETTKKRKHGISVIPGLGIYGTPLLSWSTVNYTNNLHGSTGTSTIPSFLFVSGTKKSDSLGCVVSGGRKRCKPQPNNNFVGRIVPTGMLYWQWMLTWPCSIKVNYNWNMCSWPWQPWHKMCVSP